jgi:hypothetical protein
MEGFAEIDSEDSTDYAEVCDRITQKEDIGPLTSVEDKGTEAFGNTETLDVAPFNKALITDPIQLASAEKIGTGAIAMKMPNQEIATPIETQGAELVQRPCMECSQHNAIHYCTHCDSEMCDDCCRRIHSHRILATHERVPIATRPPPTLLCKIHDREPIKLFCTEAECRQPVCVLCAFGAHQKHNCRVIDDVVLQEKASLLAHLRDTDYTIAGLSDRITDINRAEAALRANHALVSTQLKDDFNAVRVILDTQEATLASKLDAHVDKRIKDFQHLLSETEEQLKTLTDSVDRARHVYEQEGVNFLSLTDDTSRQVQASTSTAGTALSSFETVPSDELEYKVNFSESSEDSAGLPVASMLCNSGKRLSLSTVLQKPLFGEHLIVSGTVVLDPPQHGTGSVVMPLKYGSITVKEGGILTVRAWEGPEKKGGVLALIINGQLLIEEGGRIDVSGKGFRGGAGAGYEGNRGKSKKALNRTSNFGSQGESTLGIGTFSMACNGGGGGGGCYNTNYHSRQGGSGGGFGSAGSAGITLSSYGAAANQTYSRLHAFESLTVKGGFAYGCESLDDADLLNHMLLGSGGGGGVNHHTPREIEPAGGNGGGSLLIKAESFCNYGEILSNGADGYDIELTAGDMGCGGGGGSGGAIKIVADELHELGKILAVGGKGGFARDPYCGNEVESGGEGGLGRIRIEDC